MSFGPIILTAVLVGLGLFGLFYWLLTFNWIPFAGGVAFLLGGAVLMIYPWGGVKRAK